MAFYTKSQAPIARAILSETNQRYVERSEVSGLTVDVRSCVSFEPSKISRDPPKFGFSLTTVLYATGAFRVPLAEVWYPDCI